MDDKEVDCMSRVGRQTFVYDNPVEIASHVSYVGPKEGKGPLAKWFDVVLEDDLMGQKSWELAESHMLTQCVEQAEAEAGLAKGSAQAFLSGDLNDQIIASSFAARAMQLPFLGLYGACSTFVQALVVGGALISGGFLETALCAASSHFCTAERQFRFPLELGNQRPPAAHWTTTAAGCAAIRAGKSKGGLGLECGTIGKVVDLNITDANNMGAAMAPAVCDCIARHLEDTGRAPEDYDIIATGDLGWVGRNILMELFHRRGLKMPDEVLVDCGASMFYKEQDAHAGGSGCGCIASVSCGMIMKRLEAGEWNRALMVGSGAMLSPTSSMQAQSIPGIAYAVAVGRNE